MERQSTTIVATDGSSIRNPGPSGWAWVCEDGRQDWASARHSTNNRMELVAVLELLRSMPDRDILIQTDSQYVRNVFTEWLQGWKKRGMRTSRRKPVENQDLILEIDGLLNGRRIEWRWVRGHSGHELNEKADGLARYAAERSREFERTGILPTRSEEPHRQPVRPR